jgi:hypothetical protein
MPSIWGVTAASGVTTGDMLNNMVKTLRGAALVALVLAILGMGNAGPGWAIGTFLAIFTIAAIGSLLGSMSAESRRVYLSSFSEKRQPKLCRACGVEVWRFADYCGEFGDHCENTEPALADRLQRP